MQSPPQKDKATKSKIPDQEKLDNIEAEYKASLQKITDLEMKDVIELFN